LYYETQRPKDKAQIAKRLSNIEENDHFGVFKNLDNFLAELKWGNRMRVYYSIMEDDTGELTLLILGGNKNGQDSDIKKASKILKRYIEG
jgi:putative addiction module killer protein